jgi:sialate O-acetylesterase
MRRIYFFTILICCISFSIKAKVVLPNIFSDNAVLQQSASVRIWGNANPNANIIIKSSWSKKNIIVKSDASGKWVAKVRTPKGSYTPQTLTISDGDTLTIRNILIGEVWLCSGQSNMEMPVKGWPENPINHSKELIANSGQWKGVRCAMVKEIGSKNPLDTCSVKWQLANPDNTPNFSSTAYCFATSLNKALNVPVGVIVSAWGGSFIEEWLPKSFLSKYSDLDLKNMKISCDYNGMIHPLEGYTIKGFLWYQGESNVSRYNTYADKMRDLITCWRKNWGQGNLPFYMVEIAPYQYKGNGWEGRGAYLREVQTDVVKNTANTGIVCINDLCSDINKVIIHPADKETLGQRLCNLALKKTYGFGNVAADYPTYKSMKIEGNKACLKFNNVRGGFNKDDLVGFEIAGNDKVFYPATARVYKNRMIEVQSSKVEEPVAVRYCFHDFQIGNVKNSEGLPLFPFRTDDF